MSLQFPRTVVHDKTDRSYGHRIAPIAVFRGMFRYSAVIAFL